MDSLTIKIQLLEDFIKEYSHLSTQGSQEWLQERQFIIGGSEISTIMGKNKYSTIPNLIAQKLSLSSFKGNLATRWGSLFEDMTELIFKLLFLEGRAVYTTGSVPHIKIQAHRYSPDGLCVIKIKDKYVIALLEFKAPLSSIPENRIPLHYLPQIKSGLCTLDLTEQGIFMNNMFRKCKLSQLNFGTAYDTIFHKDANKKLKIREALAYGIILFHIPGQYLDDYLSLLLKEKDESVSSISDDEDEVCINDENAINDGIAIRHEFAATDSESDDMDDADDADNTDETDKASLNESKNNTLLQKMRGNVSLFLDTELNPAEYKLMDLGEFSNEEMDEWLKLYKSDNSSSFLEARYIKPNFNLDAIMNEYDNMYISNELSYIRKQSYLNKIHQRINFNKTIEKYKANCLRNGLVPVAVLPWKLIKSDVILVEKDNSFLDDHEEKINTTIQIIKDITEKGANKDDYAELLNQYYPDNQVSKTYWNQKTLSLDEINEIID